MINKILLLYIYIYLYKCCALVGLDNKKLYRMHATYSYFKILQ